MTSIFEKIKKRRKTDDGYILQSHWTSSDTVEVADDGATLSTKLDEIDQSISGLSEDKADKSTTLSGYGITDAVNISARGSANGVAPLDENGLIASSYLPSYVDDVLEGTADGVVVDDATGSQTATGFILIDETEPCTPESGKIYVDVLTNISYRWSGTIFVTVGSPLTLGETAYTAYAGDKGKANADAIEKLKNGKSNKIAEVLYTTESIRYREVKIVDGEEKSYFGSYSSSKGAFYINSYAEKDDIVFVKNNITCSDDSVVYKGLYYISNVIKNAFVGNDDITIIEISNFTGIVALTNQYEDLYRLPSINGHTLKGNLTNEDLGLSTGGDGAIEVFIGDVEPTDENITIWVNPSDEPDIIPGGGNAGIHVGEDVPTEEDVVIWLNPNGASYTITDDYLNDGTGILSQTGAYNLYNEIQSNIPTVTDNLTTNVAGTALDAKQGKILDGKITQLNDDLTGKLGSSGDGSNLTETFTTAGTRANIATGEKHSVIFGKIAKFFGDIKSVAFSGSYNDLINKPTIPTVNNGTLTIQKNGSNIATFTANQSGNSTANITVPSVVNNLTTTSTGSALDASRGKALNDALSNKADRLMNASQWNGAKTFTLDYGCAYLAICYPFSSGNINTNIAGAAIIVMGVNSGATGQITYLFRGEDGKDCFRLDNNVLTVDNYWTWNVISVTKL